MRAIREQFLYVFLELIYIKNLINCILDLPRFLVSPTDVEITAGSTLSLPCQPSPTQDVMLLWQKEGSSDMISHHLPKTHLSVNHHGSLVLRELTVDDTGYYRCILLSNVGSSVSGSHVYVHPKLPLLFTTPPPASIAVQLSETVYIPCTSTCSISCSSSAACEDCHPHWYKDHKPIDANTSNIHIIDTGILITGNQLLQTYIHTTVK